MTTNISIPPVYISRIGDKKETPTQFTQKYIMVEILDQGENRLAVVSTDSSIHLGIAYDIKDQFGSQIQFKVSGGGRLKIDSAQKQITLYGYSIKYGRANHNKAAEILKSSDQYKDYEIIVDNNPAKY